MDAKLSVSQILHFHVTRDGELELEALKEGVKNGHFYEELARTSNNFQLPPRNQAEAQQELAALPENDLFSLNQPLTVRTPGRMAEACQSFGSSLVDLQNGLEKLHVAIDFALQNPSHHPDVHQDRGSETHSAHEQYLTKMETLSGSLARFSHSITRMLGGVTSILRFNGISQLDEMPQSTADISTGVESDLRKGNVRSSLHLVELYSESLLNTLGGTPTLNAALKSQLQQVSEKGDFERVLENFLREKNAPHTAGLKDSPRIGFESSVFIYQGILRSDLESALTLVNSPTERSNNSRAVIQTAAIERDLWAERSLAYAKDFTSTLRETIESIHAIDGQPSS